MLESVTVPEVLRSIGVSPLVDSYATSDTVRSPADHEFKRRSPDISIFEIVNPDESIATIAFVEEPVMPSISPLTPEAILTAFPIPELKSNVDMSAVPPVKETPVPTSVNSIPSKIRSPLDWMPPDISTSWLSEISASPVTLTPSISICEALKPSMVAVPSTSIPIRQSCKSRFLAVRAPSTIIQDLAFEIVTLSNVAEPVEVIVR